MTEVPPSGPRSAKIFAFGERCGTHEVANRRPFAGAAGHLLDRWLAAAGLDRRHLHLDNVFRDETFVERLGKHEREAAMDAMEERIAALEDPWVLVPMGNLALRALWRDRTSIGKYRGSILEYVDRKGRRLKVIPTLNPAAIFRKPHQEKRCRADWLRIAEDSKTRELNLPVRHHGIRPTLRDIRDFLAEARSASVMAIDIETPRTRTVTVPEFTWACWGCGATGLTLDASGFEVGKVATGAVSKKGIAKTKKAIIHGDLKGQDCGPVMHEAFTAGMKPRVIEEKVIYGPRRITCVGFAITPTVSLTIPTTLSYWRDERLLRQAWELIRDLCDLPCAKALQNGHFDTFYLALDHGIHLRNWTYDTLAMHHVLDPIEDHDLAYQVSRYTREPYYKDDIKVSLGDDDDDADDEEPEERTVEDIVTDIETYWRYNGKDACVTRELVDVYLSMLRERGALDRYHAYYVKRFRPLFDMMTKGVRYDRERAASELKALGERMVWLRASVKTIAGTHLVDEDLFGDAGGISPKKLSKHLYETLKLPKQYVTDKKTKKKSVTTREVALRALAIRYPEKCGDLIRAILEYRGAGKLSNYFDGKLPDDDGYIRCSYRFTTEAMRLSSSKNPRRTGTNLQNQPPKARVVYLPDPGHIWMKLDLSQVESRIVYVLTKDEKLIEQARALPWEFDVHSYNATIIFGRQITKKDKQERDIGKMTVHGVQRGMTGKTLAERLLKKMNIVRSAAQCQAYIDRYLTSAQGLEGLFRATRREVFTGRKLVNAWGDEWAVPYERMDDDLFRRAYSFKPQSNNARLIDMAGMVPMYYFIRARGLDARLLLQVHDELDFSVAPEDAWELYETAKASLEREIDYEGVKLSVPVEVAIGPSWGESKDFARPPSRDEFEQRVAECVGMRRVA